ncbi:MAG TPA: hypothetical protein VES42_21565, partial [Pilimelia sp.]|nr:hypothetical protein [Pilimelia sp.]
GNQAGGGGGPSRRVSTAGTLPVPSIGFLVGGVLLLLGAVLLITLRRRLRGRRDAALPPVAYGGPAYRPAAYYGPRR